MSTEQRYPLMKKATAVWLVENTSLTFKQIAEFCGLHELEIKGISDEEVAVGIAEINPIITGQLEKSELDRCSKDPNAVMQISTKIEDKLLSKKTKKRTKYIPVARRQDKPDAIYWLLKNFPEISDTKIIQLVGTTKSTIESIKNRSHWNIDNIRQRDPVLLGICSQTDLDRVIKAIQDLSSQ